MASPSNGAIPSAVRISAQPLAILKVILNSARVPIGWFARFTLRLADRGGRFKFLSLWQRWEPLAMWLWRVRLIRPGGVLQFGLSPYRGQTAVLLDGTLVRRGARIIHLHFDNRRVAGAVSPGRNLWALVDLVSDDLDALAREVESGRLGEVQAVRGVTVLAAAAKRIGFEVRPLPHNLRLVLIRYLSGLVLASYHRDGLREVDRGLPWPGEVWMSSTALLGRLEPGADRTHHAEVESGP